MDKTEVALPGAKVGVAVGTAAVAKVEDIRNVASGALANADFFTLSWSNLAAGLAALYTASMLLEFWWKKFWRPLAIRRGWITPKVILTAEEESLIERRRARKAEETTL